MSDYTSEGKWLDTGMTPDQEAAMEPCPLDMQAALLRFLRNREKGGHISASDVERWLDLWNAESRKPDAR